MSKVQWIVYDQYRYSGERGPEGEKETLALHLPRKELIPDESRAIILLSVSPSGLHKEQTLTVVFVLKFN